MANNDLSILIKAKFKDGIKGDLQTELNKIKDLKIDIGIDTKALANLNQQIKSLQTMLNGSSLKGIKIVDPEYIEKLKQDGRDIKITIQDIENEYKKLGQVKIKTNIDEETGRIKNYNIELEKTNGIIEKMKYTPLYVANKNGSYDTQFLLSAKTILDQSDKLNEQLFQNELKYQQKKDQEAQKEFDNEVKLAKKAEAERESVLKEEQNIRKKLADLAIQEEQRKQNEIIKIQKDEVKQAEQLQKQSQNNTKSQEDLLIAAKQAQASYHGNIDTKQLENLVSRIREINPASVSAETELVKLRQELKLLKVDATETANSISGKVSHAISSMFLWSVGGGLVFGAQRALHSMLDTIKEIDTQMTQLSRVMDAGTNMNQILQGSLQISNELGKSLSDTNEALIGFAQQGYSAADALAMTHTAMLQTNVSELSAKESMDNLTATMISFGIAAKDSITIVDKLNNVSNNFAVDTKTLSDALSKSAATAHTYGASIDNVLGYITAIGSVTRESGNVIGNSLKTIFSRFSSDQSVNALSAVGVDVFDKYTGEVRKVDDIIKDLATRWNSLTSTQKENIAVAEAGRFQLTRFLALFDNFQIATNASEKSLKSFGSATQENERYLQSIEASINKLKTNWTELSLVVGGSGLTNIFRGTIDAVTSLTHGFTEFTKATDGWNVKLPIIAAGVYGLGKAIIFLSEAFKVAKLSAGWIGITLVALETLGASFMSVSKSADSSAQSLMENGLKTRETADNIDKLVQKYNELKPQAENNKQKQDELNQVMQQIKSIAPQLVESMGKYGDSLDINATKAKQFTDTLKKMSDEQLKNADLKNKLDLSIVNNDLEKNKKDIDEYESKMKNTSDDIYQYQQKYHVQAIEDAKTEYKERQKLYNQQIEDARKVGNTSLVDQLNDRSNQAYEEFGKYVSEISVYMSKAPELSKALQKQDDLLAQKKGIEDRQKAIEDFKNGVVSATDALKKNINAVQENDETSEKTSALGALTQRVEESSKEIDILNKAFTEMRDQGHISAETLDKLIVKHQDFASVLSKGKDAVIDYIKNAKEQNIKWIDDEKNKTDEYIDQLQKRINAANTQSTLMTEDERRRSGRVTELNNLNKQLEALKNQSTYLSSVKDALLADPKETNKSTQATDAYTLAINKLDIALDAIKNQLQDYPKYSEEYRKALAAEKKAIEDKIALAEKDLATMEKTGKAVSGKKLVQSNNGVTSASGKLGGNLSGYESTFVEAANKFGVDPLLAMAISMHETGNGSNTNYNNVGGMMTSSGKMHFDNLSEGIYAMVSNLARNYIQQGLTSISDIQKKYAPIGADNDPNNMNSDWANGVSKFYGQLGGITTGKDAVSDADFQKTLLERKKSIDQWKQELKNLDFEQVTSQLEEFEHANQLLDKDIEASNSHLFQYNNTSQEYRVELGKQIPLLKQKQDNLHLEAESIRNTLKANEEADEQHKLTAVQVDSLNEKLTELGISWWNYEQQISKIKVDQVESQLQAQRELIDSIDQEVNLHKTQRDLFDQTSQQYTDETQQILLLTSKKIALEQEYQKSIRNTLDTQKLSEDERKKLEKDLIDSQTKSFQLQHDINEEKSKIADEVIDAYKKIYEAQKKAAVDAIEEQVKAEDLRHKTYVENLEYEQKKFEDVVSAKLKLIDDQYSAEVYAQELAQKEKERQETQNKLNLLNLDNSPEGKKQRDELQKDLLKQDQEIQKLKHDHEKDIRKKTLQDILDTNKNEAEDKKKAEDDKYNATKDSLDKQKTATEKMYDDLIGDERKFAQIREQIMQGHLDSVMSDLNRFTSSLSGTMSGIGENIKNGLIDKLKEAQQNLAMLQQLNLQIQQQLQLPLQGGVSVGGASFPSDSVSVNSDGATTVLKDTVIDGVTIPAGTVFYNESQHNGGNYSSGSSSSSSEGSHSSSNSSSSGSSSSHSGSSSSDGVTQTSSGWSYGGNSYSNLSSALHAAGAKGYDTGGMTPSWGSDGKIALLHEKELVLNKFDTSNILKTVDIVRNLANYLRLPSLPTLSPSAAVGDGKTININITGNTISGDQKGADWLFSKVVTEVKKWGGNI